MATLENPLSTELTRSDGDALKCAACPKCAMHQLPGDEWCRLLCLRWNVTEAMRIVQDGREPFLVAVNELVGSLAKEFRLPDGRTRYRLGHRIELNHIAHVDPDQPGIVGFAVDSLVLIDGHHRVARCEQLCRQDFQVFVLSKEESDSVLDQSSRHILRELRIRLGSKTGTKLTSKRK